MNIKVLTEHHLEFLSLKEAAQTRLSLHMSNATLLEISCRGSIIILKLISFLAKIWNAIVQLGLVARKPVFGVSFKVSFKPVSSATETS